MTCVVGLDLSLASAGVAVVDMSHAPDVGPVRLKVVGRKGTNSEPYEQRAARIVKQTRDVLALVPGDAALAVIEGPTYGTMQPSAWDRAAVWWGVHSGVLARGIPVGVINPNTMKLYVTGDGRADKKGVINAISDMWPGVDHRGNDNLADALGLASMALHYHAPTLVPYPLKPRHTTQLSVVKWGAA